MTLERGTSCGAGRAAAVVMQNKIAIMDELMLVDDYAVKVAKKSVHKNDLG